MLTGACCHAWWNLILKQTGGGTGFFLLFSGFSCVLPAPVAFFVWWIEQPVMGWQQFAILGGSATLHLLYFLALDHGYQHGDLSIVYPLARGTGPVLTLCGAMLLLGERPSIVAIGGSLLIAFAVLMLVGDPRKLRESGNSRDPGRSARPHPAPAGRLGWVGVGIIRLPLPHGSARRRRGSGQSESSGSAFSVPAARWPMPETQSAATAPPAGSR